MLAAGSAKTPVQVPAAAADAYCIERPEVLCAEPEILCSSTKSALNGALAFPPPPYTWLITSVVDCEKECIDISTNKIVNIFFIITLFEVSS